ncbi:MAG: hypothetical protein KAG28_10510 [Cocleimonas sp.]|nr:hypothetical protein [Cocleimonas sp.]
MVDFLNNILTFPTIFYTGLLSIVVLYWLIAIFGFAEFESVATDIEGDINADGTDAGALAVWLTRFKLDGIPLTFSLSFIIFASWVICFFAADFVILAAEDAGIKNDWVIFALGFWVLILSPALALPIVVPLLAPVKPLMRKLKEDTTGASAHDFVGRSATVRSEKINNTHGSVELSDGGAGLILQVRADTPNPYRRGDTVILKRYLVDNNTYHINHN